MQGLSKLTCCQWNRSRFIWTPKKSSSFHHNHEGFQNQLSKMRPMYARESYDTFVFVMYAREFTVGVQTKASCTNWSIPQKTICSSKKLGYRSLLYIVKWRDQCCLFFFQFNLSTKPATQIHVHNESEILTNFDFWQIEVVRTEHVSKKISTFIQSGFLTNKSCPNPTFTIGQKSSLDKSTVSDHFYWSKVNIALARPVKKNMWILSIRDICT